MEIDTEVLMDYLQPFFEIEGAVMKLQLILNSERDRNLKIQKII